jgi:hypothetical protein
MNHLNDEQLILYYYGEETDVRAAGHLDECDACRASYAGLQRVLNVVDSVPIPEVSAEYGTEVWNRIAPRLPKRSRFWLPGPFWHRAAAIAAFAGLVVAAFLAGRYYPGAPVASTAALTDAQARRSILLTAVGDYLDRSQMVLVELANAPGEGETDISTEQALASGLVDETRLYRQTAARTGDAAVASVLDELERVLLDISHSPSPISAVELEHLRQRLRAEGILFKVRVLGSNVRNEKQSGAVAGPADGAQAL